MAQVAARSAAVICLAAEEQLPNLNRLDRAGIIDEVKPSQERLVAIV